MSHSTTTVVIRDATSTAEALVRIEELLDPFDENKEVDPYPEWMNAEEVQNATSFYREHPEYCNGEMGPVAPFDAYVTEGNLEAWNEWTRQAVGAYGHNDCEAGIYDAEADRFGYYSTYNPRSRWDWWAVGGRWHGFYQLKPRASVGGQEGPFWRDKPVGKERVFGEKTVPTFDGSQDALLGTGGTFGDDPEENFEGRADLARKGDIDFEAMRSLAAHGAEAAYDRFEEATQGLEAPEPWTDFYRRMFFDHDEDPDETYDGYVMSRQARQLEIVDQETWHDRRREIITEARQRFNEHPWMMALKKANLISYFGEPVEDWCVHTGGRKTFVQNAIDTVVTTHALLLDGEWYEQGRMGWFGVVADEKDSVTWNRQFSRKLDSLPDDVYLAVVDVHI